VEERPLVDQIRRVAAPGHVAVDRRVQAAEHVDGGFAEPQPVARLDHHVAGQVLDGRRGVDVDDQARARVRREQRGQAGHVEMVGVLVGDEHGVEVAHAGEVGHRAGVDEQAGAGLHEEAGVAEMGQLHSVAAYSRIRNITSVQQELSGKGRR
jgi:hypothetical protein